MPDSCPQPSRPLDADGLRQLAVLMAVYDGPERAAGIADKLARLAAPGFDTGRARIDAEIDRLAGAGCLHADAGDPADATRWRIAAPGRELATELGGRAPGQACDATRTCLLLRLCLDGTMPAANRPVLVASLLSHTRTAAPGAYGSRARS